MRCATASRRAGPPARPSSTWPARPGSAVASSTITSGPRSGCPARWSPATRRAAVLSPRGAELRVPPLDEPFAKAKTVDDVLDVLVNSLTEMIKNEPGFFLLLYELFRAGRRNPDIRHER